MPLASAVKETELFNRMLPVKRELKAPVPPIVLVPVLPAWTVIALAMVYAPLVSKLALLEPDVLPSKIALVAFPRDPALPDGAEEASMSVPESTVVIPV